MASVANARSRVAAVSVAISLAGCSTTATIHRTRGPAYEATILRSDPTSLQILGDDERVYHVPCREVSDIDHPGNVLATFGATVAGIAGLAAWSIAHSAQADSKNGATAIGVVYGVPGLLMLFSGGTIWLTSRSRARSCEEAPVRGTPPAPPAYAPPYAPPPWPPAAPDVSGSKPPIRLEAEPMPPQAVPPAPPPQAAPVPAPPAPEPEPAPQQ